MDLLQIESIIRTQISVRVKKKIGSRFPNMSFTSELSDKEPSFPNVYIHLLPSSEKGNTLENNVINAIDATIQVMVTTNTSKDDALVVANECIKAFKELSFTTPLPVPSKYNNIYRYDFRCHRIIAGGDKFN